MRPSEEYRQWMRECVRMWAFPEHTAALCGQNINDLRMRDLEAFFELIFGDNPRDRAPPGYRPTRPDWISPAFLRSIAAIRQYVQRSGIALDD